MRFSVTRRLIEWRLHWGLACGRIFLRHWQWFVLATVLVPGGTPLRGLVLFIAMPILQALQPGHGMGWYLGSIGLLALSWILVQRQALCGGGFAVYTRTLPLSTLQRLAIDTAVLIPANTLLLAPLAAAVLTASDAASANAGSLAHARLGALALLARRPRAALPLLLGMAALAWELSVPGAPWAWLLLTGALGLSLRTLLTAPAAHGKTGSGLAALRSLPARLAGALPPAWRIQAKALTTAATGVRVLGLLAIALAAHVLMSAFEFDARALPTAALALAAQALVLAGWYRNLHDARAPMAAYHRALPWHRRFWLRQDLGFVVFVGLLPALGVLLPWWAHGPSAWPVPSPCLLATQACWPRCAFPCCAAADRRLS